MKVNDNLVFTMDIPHKEIMNKALPGQPKDGKVQVKGEAHPLTI